MNKYPAILFSLWFMSFSVVAQDDWSALKEELAGLGKQHDTAWSLYMHLKDQANGGSPLRYDDLPDWSGTYSRNAFTFSFDPDQENQGFPTANLTPEHHAITSKRIEDRMNGIEYDNISGCRPPGHPRWLTEPFLREFAVAPDRTLLINEMVNDIRRIFTDGRDHVPEADRYPLYNGDSIGFWDGHKLVIHTNQLSSGMYQRGQPDYTEQVETVEIWEKIDDKNLRAYVWVYDPPVLVEPWFVRQHYTKLTDEDQSLRIRYWHCDENPNNRVIETDDGNSDFLDFDFTDMDNK